MDADYGVSVRALLRALEAGGSRLPFEIGAFVVLEACERVGDGEAAGDADTVFIARDGSVLVRGAPPAPSPEAATRTLLGLLGELLRAAGGGVPPRLAALSEAGPAGGGFEVPHLRDELESALVPLNRGASRRVLARLVKDVPATDAAAAPPAVASSDLDADLDALLGTAPGAPAEDGGAEPRTLPGMEVWAPATGPSRPLGTLVGVSPTPARAPASEAPRARAPREPMPERAAPASAPPTVRPPRGRTVVGVGPTAPLPAKAPSVAPGAAPAPSPPSTPAAAPVSARAAAPAAGPATRAPGAVVASVAFEPTQPVPRSDPSPVAAAEPRGAGLAWSEDPSSRAADATRRPRLSTSDAPARRGAHAAWRWAALFGGLALATVVLVAVVAGGEDDPSEAEAHAGSAVAAGAPGGETAQGGELIVRAPDRAQVFLFVGRGPAVASGIPVGVAQEFLAVSDAGLSARAVVPSGAPWDRAGAVPTYELALQAPEPGDPGAEALRLGATRLPRDVGSPTGAHGSVRIVTTPLGAKVYRLVGFGPEARGQGLRTDLSHELLVYVAGAAPERVLVGPSDWVDIGGARKAEIVAGQAPR